MAVSIKELEEAIRIAFPEAIINISDLANDQDHYALEIQDRSFQSLPLIKQHRMVKDALSHLLHSRLHSITIKTKAL
jgi:stress-induced morphogen